ncbi:PLDc N-terminal domain-containing protein [Methanococcoides seepicolus]|uniref:PLDc N-terminal domain-containing protein n=1 Tax=Methanococcoides seepicolus TaxID=2828780 RepID=A0A9E4ZER8_9EURY|nr:PLDc N-terminal domain-containing protein [Methanococcoides seepicolus]MCM1986347.1 PLDc N-terminal domain-containing protein [Methanococcoides seepicolus]
MNRNSSKWIVFGIIALSIIAFTIQIGVKLLWGIIAIAIVFWLFMLCDCLQRNAENFPSKGYHDKLIWSLVLIFLNFIGAILYYYLVKVQINNGTPS